MVFTCRIRRCLSYECTGRLRPLPAVRSMLVGTKFLQGVWVVCVVCDRCRGEWGPWDSAVNRGVEVHNGVCFTPLAADYAYRELTENIKCLSEVSKGLVENAMLGMLDGVPPARYATPGVDLIKVAEAL